MTNKFKRSVRERMKKTGESYQAAHNALAQQKAEESPSIPPLVENSESAAEPHQNEGNHPEMTPDGPPEQSTPTPERRPKGSWREVSPGNWAHDQHSVTIRAGKVTEFHHGREETYDAWEVVTTKPHWFYRRLADAKRAATNLGRWYG